VAWWIITAGLFAVGGLLGIAQNVIAAWLPTNKPRWFKTWHLIALIVAIACLFGLLGLAQTLTSTATTDQTTATSPAAPSLSSPPATTNHTITDPGAPSINGSSPTAVADPQDPCRQRPMTPADLPRTKRYVLKESNTPFTNANDKVDFDTGEPGHGPQRQGSWNPARDGRLADLIIEHSELHTGCRSPQMLLTDRRRATDVAGCRSLLTSRAEDLTSSLLLSDLGPGDTVCVRTDEGLVALVKIFQLVTTYPTTLTIDTVVDKP
jgi:hypothetical protein